MLESPGQAKSSTSRIPEAAGEIPRGSPAQPGAQRGVGNGLRSCEAEKPLATFQFRNYNYRYAEPVQSASGHRRESPRPPSHPRFSGGALPDTPLASGDAQPLP